MPRPRNPDGGNVNLCVRISDNLLAEIDAARGDQSRSDWGRDAFTAALGHGAGPVPGLSLVASEPEPERSRKPGKVPCDHRIRPGAYCKTCERMV